MNVQKKIERLTNWQLALFVGPIVLQVLRLINPPSPDSDRQLAVTLIRFGFTVACLVAVIVLQIYKSKIAKAAKTQSAPEPPPSFGV